MRTRVNRIIVAALAVAAAGATAHDASAAWELGVRGAADSNVLRAVGGRQADQYLYGYLSYARAPTGEKKLDWDLGVSLEGALYRKVTEFSYGAASLSPALVYSIAPGWVLALAPFARAKAAHDSDLSALSRGARVSLQQRIGSAAYAGEYDRYTDSEAHDGAFSYRENALGAYVGYNWTPSFWTEVGYEFSRGDSYQTVGPSSSGGSMHPMLRRASRMHDGGDDMMGGHGSPGLRAESAARGRVESHELTATMGHAWTSAFSTYAGYTYGRSSGDFGSRDSHVGFLGSAYRF